MGWIHRDFICTSSECQHVFDDLVQRDEENPKCPVCGAGTKIGIYTPNVATYSMMSKDDQAKCLRKRSRDHTRKMLKKDPTTARMTKRLKMKGTGG